ncbi:MAG: porin [Bacteroidetes bacterium]|nr:MAG: porin [Bacteroidota bacterium]
MKKYGLLLCALVTMTCVHAQVIDSTEFAFGGYIKTDFINTWYMNGEVGSESPLRDFHLPSQIPIGPRDENFGLDFHVKESRFNFDVTTKILGKEIHGFLELDFILSSQGDEKVSNSFNPRLRHFYFEWDRLLIGQTWSTFMIVVVPDDLDFFGATEGIVASRQPMIRYKHKNWMFALENPETTLTRYQESGVEVSEKEILPDVVVRRNFTGDWGMVGIAAIYRTLSGVDTLDNKKRTPAFGLTAGGKLKVGQRGDDFRFMATGGTGLGRYLAANFVAGGVLDENIDINAIPSINGYVAWNHYWMEEKLSSSFNVSGFKAFHDSDLIGGGANAAAFSISGNLKYNPVKQMMLGMELMTGYREVENGINGRFYRLQFSARYSFGYKNRAVYEKG